MGRGPDWLRWPLWLVHYDTSGDCLYLCMFTWPRNFELFCFSLSPPTPTMCVFWPSPQLYFCCLHLCYISTGTGEEPVSFFFFFFIQEMLLTQDSDNFLPTLKAICWIHSLGCFHKSSWCSVVLFFQQYYLKETKKTFTYSMCERGCPVSPGRRQTAHSWIVKVKIVMNGITSRLSWMG